MKSYRKIVLSSFVLAVALCVYAESKSECLARVNRQYSDCISQADVNFNNYVAGACSNLPEVEQGVCVAEASLARAEKRFGCAEDLSANAKNCPEE